jgi:hypothetical protein
MAAPENRVLGEWTESGNSFSHAPGGETAVAKYTLMGGEPQFWPRMDTNKHGGSATNAFSSIYIAGRAADKDFQV